MFDFATIEAYIARIRPDLETDVATIAHYLGLRREAVYTYRRAGMSAVVADRVCIRGLGIHPLHLYPDWEGIAA